MLDCNSLGVPPTAAHAGELLTIRSRNPPRPARARFACGQTRTLAPAPSPRTGARALGKKRGGGMAFTDLEKQEF